MNHLMANNAAEIQVLLNKQICQVAKAALKERQHFSIGLSGGSLLKHLKPSTWPAKEHWSLFPVDERYVALDDPDSNTWQLRTGPLADEIELQQNLLEIDPKLAIANCARQFELNLRQILHKSNDQPDMLVMGVGPDGHIASLFPGHSLLDFNSGIVTYLQDSPKPPSNRITVSMELLLKSKTVLLFIAGQSKADILNRILEADKTLPAGLLVSQHPQLHLLSCVSEKV